MRSACPAWRAGIPNSSGSFLMMSHVLPEGMPKVLALQLSEQDGVPSLVQACCICQPPPTAAVWGAAHGFLALHHKATDDLYLFCMNCGDDMVWLPPLPEGFTTGLISDGIRSGGIFFHELPVTSYVVLSNDHPRLHWELMVIDLGLPPLWALLKYAMHTWNIHEDCGNHKKLTLQFMRIISCQGKKVLEEWRATMSNSYHASW